ncbi:MAG: ROK family protein [Pelosinus sp.]|nr:ROK family protein [Pelosinus sp.]
MKYHLGIDIGGTFIKYALVDDTYQIIEKWKVPTVGFNAKNEFYDYVCANCKDLSLVKAIGISAPGVFDQDGILKSYAAPNVRIMHGTNVAAEVALRTGKTAAAINDAKAAGLCELKIGNARNTESSAFLIIGTGIGGCLCDKDDVIYGKDFFAGEFHFIPFVDFRNNSIDVQGNHASMTALLQIYNSKTDQQKAETGEEITAAYLAGDKTAKLAVDEWTTNIVIQLLAITVFYNPAVICIGGGISEEAWFINLLREKFGNILSAQFSGAIELTTEIRPCKYTNDANILGAIINGKRHDI